MRSNVGLELEGHLDVHSCKLVSQVAEHIWQSYLAALIVVTHSAVDLLIHAELLLSFAVKDLSLVLQYLSVQVATNDASAFLTDVALAVVRALEQAVIQTEGRSMSKE